MRYENKFWNRSGNVFSMQRDSIDLSDVRLLHIGVDTVKQLFNCILRSDTYDVLARSTSGDVVNLGGVDWALSRSSKQSGYQYILKNQDVGFVVLVKSFYKDAEELGPHIKIEVSPQVIYENEPAKLTDKIRFIARIFADNPIPSGCAVHLAADLKNVIVPDDFTNRFVCKARREQKFNAISHAHYDGLNEIACIYGNSQTFTYGQPGAVQFSLYDKVVETTKRDKLSFWESIWSDVPALDDPLQSEYRRGDSVRRFELRYHQSVINQFCNGSDCMADYMAHPTFERLIPHLTALWRYGLDNFRLQYSTVHIDPLWQLLIEDVEFFGRCAGLMYKRAAKAPSVNTRRNIAFFLGNFIRVAARKRLNPDFVTRSILAMGVEAEIADYFGVQLFGSDCAVFQALLDFVVKRMTDLTLDGVAA